MSVGEGPGPPPDVGGAPAPPPAPPDAILGGDAPPEGTRRHTAGTGLRIRAARGTIVNAIFLTSVNTLALIRGFLVAGFLSTTEYGIWGTVLVVLATLALLRQIGIGDKFIQQDEADQERAFRKAMTFEVGRSKIAASSGTSARPPSSAITDSPTSNVIAL